ncbi:MAG: chorismate synthase [Abditibacteriota bacterium]|nr:chorismate synthase [Abditibacteriota bacterium]
MSSTFGHNLKISFFGEAGSGAAGVVIDGLLPGTEIDMDAVYLELRRRKGGNPLTAPRDEGDTVRIVSGIRNNTTCGTPVCALTESPDDAFSREETCLPRPGHADYTGFIKYKGFNNCRGGGLLSPRATAGLVFAGAVCKQVLRARGVLVGSHILSVGQVSDEPFDRLEINQGVLQCLLSERIPLLDPYVRERMEEAVAAAAGDKTTLGGVIEGAVAGIPAGVGEPFFDSVESVLSHLLFSLPVVKGVDFGEGFGLSGMQGHEANDQMYADGGKVKFRTNMAGGVIGGISNGMPVICRAAFKPAATVARNQTTVNLNTFETADLHSDNGYDPCPVLRACPLVESMLAIGVLDLLSGRQSL